MHAEKSAGAQSSYTYLQTFFYIAIYDLTFRLQSNNRVVVSFNLLVDGLFFLIIFFTRAGTTQLIFLEEMVTKLKDLERNLLNKRF